MPDEDPIEREPPQWRVLILAAVVVVIVFFVVIPYLLVRYAR